MTIWLAVLMGLVQGLTEFLPISSSGHLVIIQTILGQNVEHDFMLFDILLHLGTLVSVFVCFWKDIVDIVREFFLLIGDLFRGKPDFYKTPARRTLVLLVVATVPMVAAALVNDWIEQFFGSLLAVGICLLVTAILLLIADRCFSQLDMRRYPERRDGQGSCTAGTQEENAPVIHRRRRAKNGSSATWKDALFIGVLQLIALLPGVSRSGTAITGGAIRGFDREYAIKFSFLLSIPVIIGANILSISDSMAQGVGDGVLIPYLIGIVVAAVAGVAAISMVRLLTRKSGFKGFRYYCCGMGILVIILSFFF